MPDTKNTNKEEKIGKISFRPTKQIEQRIKKIMMSGRWTTRSALIVHALSNGLVVEEERIDNSKAVDRNKKAMKTIRDSEYGYKGEE